MDKVGGEEGGGEMNGEGSLEAYTLPYVYGQPMEIHSMTQGTQTGALQPPRGVWDGGQWEGGARRKGHMYTYGWFMLMYDKIKPTL